MEQTSKLFDTMFEKLERFLRTETVVGEPLEVGQVTLLPIISVSFGMGGGGGGGKDEKGSDGTGAGGGLGCKIAPNAMLVIKGEQVTAIPLDGRNSLDKLVEMAPEIIAKIGERAKKEEKEEKEEKAGGEG